MKKIIVLAVLVMLLAPPTALAGEIIQMPEHGSLWRLAEECGQHGKAWLEIAAKNPWLKIKVVKGKRVPVVHSGQPIILPDDWVVAEENEESSILASLWSDYCDIAKSHPIPSVIVFLLFSAVITAKSYIGGPKEPEKQNAIGGSQKNNRRYESIVLPG